MHVQGAACEWLMGTLFIIYCLLLLPEFHRFSIHVRLEPVDHDDGRPREEYQHLLA